MYLGLQIGFSLVSGVKKKLSKCIPGNILGQKNPISPFVFYFNLHGTRGTSSDELHIPVNQGSQLFKSDI